LEGYGIAIPRPRRKEIPYLGFFGKHHGLLEGYCIAQTKPRKNAIPL